MLAGDHERNLRKLATRRQRAEKARTDARLALAQGVREAVAAGMSQHAVARAAGVTQGLVWQYLEEVERPMDRHDGINAATFCRRAKIKDARRFRQWLRDNGTFVGQGNHHRLPEPASAEGRDLIARFKQDTGR
jgi:hypothetical protein